MLKNKRKNSIIKIIFVTLLAMLLLIGKQIYIEANSNAGNIYTRKEYSEAYKKWLELPNEEKEKVLMPRMFDVEVNTGYADYLKNINNKIRLGELLRGATLNTYNLKNIIAENTKVKNQMQTGSCWAFASIGSLETNLALKDYKNGLAAKTYDFSERHMTYSAMYKAFLDNKVNPYGLDKDTIYGGSAILSELYLTNGSGAISESEMLFENNEDLIDISLIQNKNVITTVLDIIEFPNTKSMAKEELMAKIKSFITNNGGIYAGIHGAEILSDNYNNETGAIYCKNSILTPTNHAVTIIGWDDNYSKDNFNSKNIPDNNGAWIIKNSWGDRMEESLTELKETIYSKYTSQMNQLGYNSPQEIPNDYIKQLFIDYGESKISINESEDIISVEIGNEGYMYISYDDINVYEDLWAVENAQSKKDYDNLYQNDISAKNNAISATVGKDNAVYIANVFERDSSKLEELTKISLYTFQEYECKVYVNPNGNSLKTSDLQEARLAAGDTESFESGYHTIEFAEPIKLTGNSFSVVVEVNNSYESKTIALESNIKDSAWAYIEVNSGESFVSMDKTEWTDLTTLGDDLKGNLTIKAFTNNYEETQKVQLERIEIKQVPNKITYYKGEDFNAAGMIVEAIYSNSTKAEITNYTITNGTNLQIGQNSVTINYTEDSITKTTTQDITVQEEINNLEVNKIEVLTKPTKLQYVKDIEDLNLNGGVIKVTYTDDSTRNVDMTNENVSITGFDNTKLGKNTITVSYNSKTTTFDVEIIEKSTEEQEPVSSDFNNSKTSITNFKIDFSTENPEEAYYIIDMKVTGIKIGDRETSYKYYYYLSGTQGDKDIDEGYWIDIDSKNIIEETDGTYSINIKIDSRELPNKTQIASSDNLYLYIKEIATIGSNSKTQINTMEVIVDSNVDDDDKIDDIINNNQNNGGDPTISKDNLPNAGIVKKMIIAFLVISIIAGFSYHRFKNIDK